MVHMLRFLVVFLVLLPLAGAYSQGSDSLFAVKKESNWELKYTVKERENARMLAKRFYVSEGQMEYANSEGTMRKLTEGATVYIPVTKENFFTTKPPPLKMKYIHELYYIVNAKDDISIISNYSGVTKAEMRAWNDLRGNTLKSGQRLFIGWVRMMVKDSSNPGTLTAFPAPKKTVEIDTTGNAPVPGGLDTVFNIQTNNGLNVLAEKGTAVFFEKPGKNTMYYAFHNEAARGSIVKVYNPGSGKTTYVKILGPLPDTKLYANSIIGICEGAKEDLGITDNKAWVELSYAAD
jgi:LysM repeat protein